MKIFSLIFLLIFSVNQLANGMQSDANQMPRIYKSQKDKRERKGKGAASSSAPVVAPSILRFSLSELSFLTETLRNIEFNSSNNPNELFGLINSIGQRVYPQVNLDQVMTTEFNEKFTKIVQFYLDVLHAQEVRIRQEIVQGIKFLFVVWHLFGVARNLIHSFLEDYSRNKNQYDRELSQNGMLISVFSYIKAFDELEGKAKIWMGWLRTFNVLQGGGAIRFRHEAVFYTRPKMLMSLQEAENHVHAIYPVQFEDVGNNDNIVFNFLINMKDLFFPKLTYGECQNINGLIQLRGNIGFYTLYYEQVHEIVKRKIDILIGRKLKELFIGNKEYLPENSENLPARFNFVMKIRDECLAIKDDAESSTRGIDLGLKL